jgi:DNA polymerase kappa
VEPLTKKSAEEVAAEIREKICQATGGLTASCGIGPNRRLAKIASDFNKPNGQFVIGNSFEEVMRFVKPLPIRKVNCIGRVTDKMLVSLGINTCEDLWEKRALIQLLFKPKSAEFLLEVSMGLGATEVEKDYHRKGLSSERSFHPTGDRQTLEAKLRELANTVAEQLQQVRPLLYRRNKISFSSSVYSNASL